MSRDFDKASHDRNDKVAKQAVISYMEADGEYIVKENSKFGVDLIVFSAKTNECLGYVEVERAETWWNYKGRYHGRNDGIRKYIRIPGRKKHFLRGKDSFDFDIGREADLPYGEKEILFATVNKYSTDIMFVMSSVVKTSFFEEDDITPNARSGSKFMCVPLDKWAHGEVG